MPGTYTGLFSEIVTSSIWSEDDKTRILWVTMLALKDKDGIVRAAVPGLAKVACMSIEDCQKAIAKLEAPDVWSRSKEHDGRRIQPNEEGWLVLNHFKYRNKLSTDPEAIAARERQRKHRDTALRHVTSRDADTESDNDNASMKEEDCQEEENKRHPELALLRSRPELRGITLEQFLRLQADYKGYGDFMALCQKVCDDAAMMTVIDHPGAYAKKRMSEYTTPKGAKTTAGHIPSMNPEDYKL